MIWFDIAVTLLSTLRMVLFGPTLPRLLDPENDSSSLIGNKGEEESLLDAEGEEDESSTFRNWLSNTGSSAITYSCNA
jgi:hypothetical protein